MTDHAESLVAFIAPAKAVSDTIPYGFDWTKWLNGDTISVSNWAFYNDEGVVTADLVQASKSIDSATHSITSIYLSGGVSGEQYTVTNTITTVANTIKTLAFLLPVV